MRRQKKTAGQKQNGGPREHRGARVATAGPDEKALEKKAEKRPGADENESGLDRVVAGRSDVARERGQRDARNESGRSARRGSAEIA